MLKTLLVFALILCVFTMSVESQSDHSCPPDKPLTLCFFNPCRVTRCPLYPHARCRPEYCGDCYARFFVGFREVTQRCNS